MTSAAVGNTKSVDVTFSTPRGDALAGGLGVYFLGNVANAPPGVVAEALMTVFDGCTLAGTYRVVSFECSQQPGGRSAIAYTTFADCLATSDGTFGSAVVSLRDPPYYGDLHDPYLLGGMYNDQWQDFAALFFDGTAPTP